jgi:hypothetical protein
VELFGKVFGPQLDAIESHIRRAVDVLIAFFKGDRELRAAQAANEPLAEGMQQGSNVNGTDTISIPTGSVQQQTPFTTFLDGQDTTAKKYSYIVVIIEGASGAGRYSLQKGNVPTQAGAGHSIPSGGTVLTIPGTVNIANFKMCPETGQTLTYTMQGFQ